MSEHPPYKIKSQFNQDQKESEEKGKIFIKKEAFRNMITHVLRFGNDALEESVAVVGVCLGNVDINGENVIIVNAIPISHGNGIEMEFLEEMQEAIAQIEKEHENTSVLGWYHSHPGKGLYFSDVDKKNQQYFQKKDNPHGFGMVFDHSLMGEDGKLGFEVYRLNNYKKIDQYHQVSCDIETPNSLEYFKWVQKFVEDFQKKMPVLINELNELGRPPKEELQEIPSLEEEISQKINNEDNSQLESIVSGFEKETFRFSETIVSSLKPQLGAWTKNFDEDINKGSEYTFNIIEQMNDAISSGLAKVQNWFDKNLGEISNNFKNIVAKNVGKRIKFQNELIEKINKESDNLIDISKNLAEKAALNIIDDLKTRLKLMKENLNEISQNNGKLRELVNKISNDTSNIFNYINNISDKTAENMKRIDESLQENILIKLKNLKSELDLIKQFYLDINNIIQKLYEFSENFQDI